MKTNKLKSPQHWMLPFLLIGFIGPAVTFLSPFINTSSRWAILLLALFYILLRKQLTIPLKSNFGFACFIYISWCILTTAWSELPELSLLKSIALSLIIPTSLACGMYWVKTHEPNEALNYLIPLTYITILAGVLGKISDKATVQLSDTVQLYQGAVGGPNMFGSMLAMCAPLLIWKVYTSFGRTRIYWFTLLCTALYYLLASKSRSSFLCVLSTIIFFYMGYSTSNKLFILIISLITFTSLYFYNPDFIFNIEQDYINKHHSEEGVFYSRNSDFENSYIQATKGGIIGGGYGVNIGDSNLTLDFTASNYGREKTNSQLAIIEETGVIGLVFYATLLISLFTVLRRGINIQKTRTSQLQILLVTGSIFGMIVKSIFEAWWVAPGSPESVYFWCLCGIALGLCKDSKIRNLY